MFKRFSCKVLRIGWLAVFSGVQPATRWDAPVSIQGRFQLFPDSRHSSDAWQRLPLGEGLLSWQWHIHTDTHVFFWQNVEIPLAPKFLFESYEASLRGSEIEMSLVMISQQIADCR